MTTTPRRCLRVAVVIPDNRDETAKYDLPEPYFGSAPTALFSGFEKIENLEVHVLSCLRREARSPAKIGRNVFFHPVQVPECGFLKTGYQPALRRIAARLRMIKPDIVHGQGTERYAALAAVNSGFSNVVTVHGNMRQVAKALKAKPFSFHWLTARFETWSLKRCGGIICLTTYTKRLVQSVARKTWIIPNAVNEAFFSVPRNEAVPPKILCVATVASYKGQNELIRALDSLAAQHRFQLLFLGEANPADPYGKEFLDLVESRKWTRHAGFKAGLALREELGSARLLILPSREDNCPMVLLEAMAAGLPIAASRIGGIPDLIDDGVNGMLFNPQNANEIRATVAKSLLQLETIRQIASAARTLALERHAPINVALNHLSVYEEMVGEQDRHSSL